MTVNTRIHGSTDAAFDILSHQRRRYVLSYFHDADDDVAALTDLVDWVTTREVDREGDHRQTVAVEAAGDRL